MTVESLTAAAVGPPEFALPAPSGDAPPRVFDLSSHRRAREALAFALAVPRLGYNVFVLGEDRSGRMTATLELLEKHAQGLPPAADWLYLPNFRHPREPRPCRLPAGVGRQFRDRLGELLAALGPALRRAFEAAEFASRVEQARATAQQSIGAAFGALNQYAAERGLAIDQGEKGMSVRALPGNEPQAIDQLSQAEREQRLKGFDEVRQRVVAFVQQTHQSELAFAEAVSNARREAADAALGPLIDPIAGEYGSYSGLGRWLVELRVDLLDHLDLLAVSQETPDGGANLPAEERYQVNLLVDHGDDGHASVVVEPNPSYERLFGSFDLRIENGVAVTDYRLIRAGSLHRANGGILVVRAEAIAAEPMVWNFLKGALRDRCIRIEPPRGPMQPVSGAPYAPAIPLEVKVVMIGAPRWYYTFFSLDPDFATYFKVKADIDADMPADDDNLRVYADMIRHMARQHAPEGASDDAVARTLAEAARWAQHRGKLSAQFERVEDLVIEAATVAERDCAPRIGVEQVRRALALRREHRARIEDRSQEAIRDGVILIDTSGTRIGQVNALTVRDLGDHSFGLPVRVSARVHAGRLGIANIERATEMGGPIQQKGVYIIGGYLSGLFAGRLPLSFSASVTFEQSYGGVEGDSASMGELVAVLSALAEAPIRQDIAITGSVNQAGESQPIGGAIEKVEGFYRVCAGRGLTGTQGVLIPRSNRQHLILSEEVTEALAAGRFHLWTMANVEDAIRLLTGLEPGRAGDDGRFPAGSLLQRVEATLDRFDRLLAARTAPLR
ncbi:MAG TPA: ATP-binding protein [Stellaceae bacterium]|nr:ATP-binding protein [Stellaceae bacterium]